VTNSLERIFESLVKALEAEILPRLDDEYARGQLHGAIELLANLKTRVDWNVGPLYDDVAARLELAGEIERALGDERSRAPARPAVTLDQPRLTGTELAAMRDWLDRWLGQLLRWLAVERGSLGARAAEIEAAILPRLRTELKREVSLTAPPRFGEISRGR
jgi:hypothetical protein